MTVERPLTRTEAIEALRCYAIEGADIYLIDLIPIIEMIWADGVVQEIETTILDEYIKRHVAHINGAAGYKVMTLQRARGFVQKYLKERPDPELLRTLRSFVGPVRITSPDSADSQKLKKSLLAVCLDIAASAVTSYPYRLKDRFNPAEKQCFFEILESLEGGGHFPQPAGTDL